MKLWVDAKACSSTSRDVLVKVAQRLEVTTVFVAMRDQSLAHSGVISSVSVGIGKDAVDKYLEKHGRAGDLLVTQNIALAGRLVAKGLVVMDPRGDLYTPENVHERVSVRDFVQELRVNGVMTGVMSGYSQHDHQQFAASLERHLTRLKKGR